MAASKAPASTAQAMASDARRALLARKSSLVGDPHHAAELEQLDAALRRLDEGTWGRCVTCGGAIGRTRLKAMPEVAECLGCSRKPPGPQPAQRP